MGKVIKSRLLAVHASKVLVLQKIGEGITYTLPGGVKKRSESEKQALIRKQERK